MILNIFSKRGIPVPEVFGYDALPKPLRIQIVHIWSSTLGMDRGYATSQPTIGERCWALITSGLARELGRVELAGGGHAADQAARFLVDEQNTVQHQLDIVEVSFAVIDNVYREKFWEFIGTNGGMQTADEAIEELNHRFLEHGVGYRFESGQIIRMDSTYTHAAVIQPALVLLADKRFKNAEHEFLLAHKAYREQRYSDCLNEALKAFESTMKIICASRKWPFQPTDAASRLIGVVLDNGLVPTSYQTQFTSLRQVLESGTPTVRNKNSAHGQGASTVLIPDYLAQYALNTAAANIALLVEAFNS